MKKEAPLYDKRRLLVAVCILTAVICMILGPSLKSAVVAEAGEGQTAFPHLMHSLQR